MTPKTSKIISKDSQLLQIVNILGALEADKENEKRLMETLRHSLLKVIPVWMYLEKCHKQLMQIV
jgi:hypothetical protein